MKKFEVGKRYEMRSVCNHDCVWRFVVISRTDKTIRLLEERESQPIMCRIKKAISEHRNCESVMPFGSYSMAPILSADDKATK